MKKYNIGDIIVYKGSKYPSEYCLFQVIDLIEDDNYYTYYLNNNDNRNMFGVNSTYARECEIVPISEIKSELYDNGIPLIWGDNI